MSDKNINEMDIDKLVVSVYNQIAEWNNDGSSSPGLKQLSFDVITEITTSVCEHFEIPFSGEIKVDETLVKEAQNKDKKD